MRDDRGAVHLNRIDVAKVRGTRHFDVKLMGGQQTSVAVTLWRGSETYVHRTPRLYVVVPNEFVVECRFWKHGTEMTVPCEAEDIPAAGKPRLLVRSADSVPLGEIRVNGVTALNAVPFPLADVVPKNSVGAVGVVAGGDYPIQVEVNPPPDTIHRNLTIRVR
jgi:hypothetical protein